MTLVFKQILLLVFEEIMLSVFVFFLPLSRYHLMTIPRPPTPSPAYEDVQKTTRLTAEPTVTKEKKKTHTTQTPIILHGSEI